jgi:uncharacterized protein (TIGR02444 family)
MSPAVRFWTFSLSIYAAPGVETACLDLQDRLGADVNVVLYCLWIGRPLSRASLEAAMAEASSIGTALVAPLRAMRRSLARQGDEAPVRQAVKAAELEAEKLVQARLETLGGSQDDRLRCAAPNLVLYANLLRADGERFLAAAAPLLSALAAFEAA